MIKKCKLKCFGHVSRAAGLAKTILQGTMQGGRRRVGRVTSLIGKGWSFVVTPLENLKTKSNGGKGLLRSGCRHDYRVGAGAGARFWIFECQKLFLTVHCGTNIKLISCYVDLDMTECMLYVLVMFPNPFMHAVSHHQWKVGLIEFASYTCTTPSYFMVE